MEINVQSSLTVPALAVASNGEGPGGAPPILQLEEFWGVACASQTKAASLLLVSVSATRAIDAGDAMLLVRVPSAKTYGMPPSSSSSAATLSRIRPVRSTKAALKLKIS